MLCSATDRRVDELRWPAVPTSGSSCGPLRGPRRRAELAEDELLAVVVANTGVPLRMIRTARRYWANYAEEIDAEIRAAEVAESAAEAAWLRQRHLLGR